MQSTQESVWGRIRKELYFDDVAISQLKEKARQDGVIASFFDILGHYFGSNSFNDLCSQLMEMKGTLDTTANDLATATAKVANLEATNERLSQANSDLTNSLQLQISETQFYKGR